MNEILSTEQDMRVGRGFNKYVVFSDFEGGLCLTKQCDFSRVGQRGDQVGRRDSATRAKVYTARFRRAKRLQLERQVIIEILHGGRIHRQIRSRNPCWVSLRGENDRGCSGNPSQRPETLG